MIKWEKLVASLQDEKGDIINIRNQKTSIKSHISFEKKYKVIKFNKRAWLKPYIDMNTELLKRARVDFEKDFFKLMNNSVFRKTTESLRKYRDIKLVTTEKK